MYLKTIGEETKSDVIKYNLDFRHIVLADFEGMPKYMNNLSNQIARRTLSHYMCTCS